MTLEEQLKEDAIERFCEELKSPFALLLLRAVLAADMPALIAVYTAAFLCPLLKPRDGERLANDLFNHLGNPLHDSKSMKYPGFSWSPMLKLFTVKAQKQDATTMRLQFRPPVCGGSVRISAENFNLMRQPKTEEVADPEQQLGLISAVFREAIIEHMRIQDRMR